MFWLRNKKIKFLLHTLNESPDDNKAKLPSMQRVLKMCMNISGKYDTPFYLGSCNPLRVMTNECTDPDSV